jgi:hypothetical protein
MSARYFGYAAGFILVSLVVAILKMLGFFDFEAFDETRSVPEDLMVCPKCGGIDYFVGQGALYGSGAASGLKRCYSCRAVSLASDWKHLQ